jgi:hypothetical protein
MDSSNFDFMKSGRSLTSTPNAGGLPPDFEKTLDAVVCTLVERALMSGMEYTEAAQRTYFTPEDLRIGLKYEATHFMNSDEWEVGVSRWTKLLSGDSISTENDNDDDDNDDDDDEEDSEGSENDEDEDEELEDTEDEPFTAAEDSSGVKIAAMNKAERDWDAYVPGEPLFAALKRAVDHAIENVDSFLHAM